MNRRHLLPLFVVLGLFPVAGCSSEPPSQPGLLDGLQVIGDDPTDVPLRGSSSELVDRFLEGDALFDAVFREVDGLGPLYIRTACSSCHAGGGRGPGAVQKVAIVASDGVTPADDQTDLVYGHTLRPYITAGATLPLEAPAVEGVKISQRLGPAVFGRGYMEAVDDEEIIRLETEQLTRSDAIHGRINRVTYTSKPNTEQSYHDYNEGDTLLIGRFGLKARVATLDDFTADAYQGDMGITSPMRPTEPPNPDGISDDGRAGIDISLDTVNAVADYMRLLEIPRRVIPKGRGAELFAEAKCSVCHAPSLKTRWNYPIPALAGIDAPVFTDFLLHRMGDDLADGLVEGKAQSTSWKTAPLIGLRHLSAYMHDGRAATVEQAILLHGAAGSEAFESVSLFNAMSYEERSELLDYVQAL